MGQSSIADKIYPIQSMYAIFTFIFWTFYAKCRYNIPYMDSMGMYKYKYKNASIPTLGTSISTNANIMQLVV